jgi:succinylglutamate desuccinylase
MFDDIFIVQGKEVGPTSIILAGVHGNEKCGVTAFQKILPTLTLDAGTVFFAYGNPRALAGNQRFTEANLNRMFKDKNKLSQSEKASYEYERAQFLKRYLNQADALLDIHASSTLGSEPFIICEPNAKSIVTYLPVALVVSGFDEVEPGGTDYYMNSVGKVGVCVECGYRDDPLSVDIAEKNLLTFLRARGHIPGTLTSTEQTHVRMYQLYKTKTIDFTLTKDFKDFETVAQGQIIGTDGSEEIRAERNSVILFAGNTTEVGGEAFLLGENKNTFV